VRDGEFTVAEPGTTRAVGDPQLALVPGGGAWVAWRVDDANGPEGGVRARALQPDGAPRSDEVVVARGSRGGFALGGVVAIEDGGCAVAWRGDEGLAWLAEYGPAGRLRRVRFLEPCEGAPALARNPRDGALVVALVRPDGRGAVALSVGTEGETREVLEGVPGGDAVALAHGPRGFGMAYRAGRALHVVDALGRAEVALPSPRMVPHASSLAACGDGWACAFVGEDTGKLSLYVSRAHRPTVRQADVWAPLACPGASAPALCASGDGLLLAWREERGPRPAVYLRVLDRDAHRRAAEVRVSTRGMVALAGRVGLAARAGEGWACAYAERREAGEGIWLRCG
jgi:hypothetical protein